MAATEVALACGTLSFAFLKTGRERYIWKGPQHWHSVPDGWFALQRADHVSLQGISQNSKKPPHGPKVRRAGLYIRWHRSVDRFLS